jgi:predicted metal-dependent hydrolase
MGEFYEKYFAHVFNWYKKHFHLFQEATEQAMEDFKKGYLGSFADFATHQTQETKRDKLKTNLTVPELAYLFNALYAEGIITSKHKSDIYKFIADNFSSKQQDDISVNSIKNHFENPDFNAVDSMHEKFTHIYQQAKKDKEK